MIKILKFLFINLLVFMIISSGIGPALSENETTPTANETTPENNETTPEATVVATTSAPTPAPETTDAETTTVATTPDKFRVGPEVRLRPVNDVIEAQQDGIVELFMRNPSLNDVTLHVDASVSVPSGIHVYGEGFAQSVGAGTAAGTFDVPPGTARTIIVVIKADKSARIGSHTIHFSGLYYAGDNKDGFQPLSLTYPIVVKEASEEPESSEPAPETSPGVGFIGVLAIFSIFAIARFLSKKV